MNTGLIDWMAWPAFSIKLRILCVSISENAAAIARSLPRPVA
jgi:hypothetical protein